MKKMKLLGLLLGLLLVSVIILVISTNYNNKKQNTNEIKVEKKSKNKVTSNSETIKSSSSESTNSEPKKSDETVSQPESTVAEQDLNIDAIANGDYTTLVGSWKNGRGESFIINSDGTTSNNLIIEYHPEISDSINNPIPSVLIRPNDDSNIGGASLELFKIGFTNPYVEYGEHSDTSRPRIKISQSANFEANDYYYRQ